jgi:hypothetical protein
VSPFGVVFAAVFWAWLWGIPGLLLATPLTVCLVVAGRYAEGLRPFAVLLGDQPALPPDMRLYQRVVAGDLDEALAVLRDGQRDASPEEVSDRIVLPALRRLAEDDRRDAWPDTTSEEIRARFAELLLDTASLPDGDDASAAGVRLLMAPALDANDALAGRWLARVCAVRGVEVALVSPHALASEVVERVEADAPDAICINALTPRATSQARVLCKRLATAAAQPEVLVGLWAALPHERGDEAALGCAPLTSAAELLASLHSLRVRLGAGTERSRLSA